MGVGVPLKRVGVPCGLIYDRFRVGIIMGTVYMAVYTNFGVLIVCTLTIRALIIGVYVRAPHFSRLQSSRSK